MMLKTDQCCSCTLSCMLPFVQATCSTMPAVQFIEMTLGKLSASCAQRFKAVRMSHLHEWPPQSDSMAYLPIMIDVS